MINLNWYILGLGCVGFLLYKVNFFGGLRKKYNKIKAVLSLLNNIENTDRLQSGNIITSITKDKYHVTLNYKYFGEKYVLSVPFDNTAMIKMLDYRVLLNKNNSTIDITQQPGIPYIMSAKSFDADSIVVINDDTGETYEYKDDIKPMYLSEQLQYQK